MLTAIPRIVAPDVQRVLVPQPITAEAFAPYGELVGARGELLMINGGTTKRYHRQVVTETGPEELSGKAIISLFRAQARTLPMKIEMLERHPLGSQAFLPADPSPYLVLVATGDDQPYMNSLALFLVAGEGVNYRAGCWHYPLLSLNPAGEERDFWVVDRSGKGHNCDEFFFPDDWDISITLPTDSMGPEA